MGSTAISSALSTVVIWLAAPAPVDFDTDLIPIFTRAGCNAGACHGGAAGRGGFKLSLLGGSPADDHETIVHGFEGRRVNLAHPDRSLLLLKPTMMIDHGGDARIDPFGPDAELIERWVAEGARRLESRRLEGFEVSPAHHIAERTGETVRLRATARFDDGTERDVTRWTVFSSSDPSALSLDSKSPGVAKITRPGQTVIVARYLDRVVPARVTLPASAAPVDLSASPRRGFIDEEILRLLETLRMTPAPPCADATFLRRARLTLTGTLPSRGEFESFVEREGRRSATEREQLIDTLLESEDFIEYWTFRLANLLRIRALPKDARVAVAFQDWIRAQLRSRAGYDSMTRSLLTALGDSHEKGEAGFLRMAGGPREQAELVSEIFMGARLRCANCHNHPLDHWTQDDYHGLAAVFARVDRGRVVSLRDRGEVTHPVTGEPAVARVPGERFVPGAADPRVELAAWLTRGGEGSGSNPYFARAFVNRVWQALMGRGLVDPVDDHRATNPASHPELLDRLAGEFVKSGYDLRRIVRLIATSAAFARGGRAAVETSAGRFYAKRIAMPLPAEVLADAITRVTGVDEIYGDEFPGTRAISLAHPGVRSPSLDLLGRCDREDTCESESDAPGLATKLHLLNGAFLNRKLGAPDGTLQRLLDAGRSSAEIVETLYVSALGRRPRDAERAFWRDKLADDSNERAEQLEDFLWSLLSCDEFKMNH